ncbi:MAG: calcium/sodium antiporter [Bacilli bacterium]
MILEIILVLIGFFLLIKGADFLVNGASDVAKKFRIPEIVIALTIVSIGTSLPELVVSVGSAIKGHSDIAIGNVVGSNISNLFLILGVCSIITPLIYKKQTRLIENPVNFFATIILFICANGLIDNNIISRSEGFLLILCAVAFIAYNIFMAKNSKNILTDSVNHIKKSELKKISVMKCVLLIVGGIVLLKFGGDFVLDNAVSLAKRFGLTEKLISLTVIAISTSLPELITSITAALKGDTDMAIGNILGSQIFNIFLIIGTSAVISPISYSLSYNKELILLMFGTLFMCLNPFFGEKNKMTKTNGIMFVSVYVIYMITVIVTA